MNVLGWVYIAVMSMLPLTTFIAQIAWYIFTPMPPVGIAPDNTLNLLVFIVWLIGWGKMGAFDYPQMHWITVPKWGYRK